MRVHIFTPEAYGYGALLIGGILEHYGAHVHLHRERRIPPSKAKIYGLSVHSVTDLIESKELVHKLSERGGIVVAGGSAAFIPELVFYILPTIDLVIYGEGENALIRVIRWLDKKERIDLEDVDGVAFKRNGTIVKTGRPEPAALEGRPLPKIPNDLCQQDLRGPPGFWGANVYLETHRGCMGRCAFCLVPRMFGTAIRSRPLHEIINEVRAFKKAGVERIAIIGGTTSLYGSEAGTSNGSNFGELLESISGIIGKENLSAADLRVDQTDPLVLDAIRHYTTGWAAFGLESGSERMLRIMNKGFGLDMVRDGINRTKKHGVKIIGSFMVAYPGEREDDFEATKQMIHELKLDGYAINVAEPIPGTPMFDLMASMELDENPLFQMASQQIKGLGKLTVAEHRALVLLRDSYEVAHGSCSMPELKEMLIRIRKECSRIAEVVRICKKFSSAH